MMIVRGHYLMDAVSTRSTCWLHLYVRTIWCELLVGGNGDLLNSHLGRSFVRSNSTHMRSRLRHGCYCLSHHHCINYIKVMLATTSGVDKFSQLQMRLATDASEWTCVWCGSVDYIIPRVHSSWMYLSSCCLDMKKLLSEAKQSWQVRPNFFTEMRDDIDCSCDFLNASLHQ